MKTGQETLAWRLRISLGIAVVLFGSWEILGQLGGLDPLFFSWPSAILKGGWGLILGGDYWLNIRTSGVELAAGFAVALLGVPIGLALGYWRTVADYLEPLVNSLYSTPSVALMPLFVIWFGLGLQSKIALAALLGIFPVLINTAAGVKGVERSLLHAARSFGASEFTIVRSVVLPASMPFVITGLRLGLGRCLIGVIIGEMIASKAGLGFMILNTAQQFQTAAYFAALGTVMLLAWLCIEVIRLLENRWVPWQHG